MESYYGSFMICVCSSRVIKHRWAAFELSKILQLYEQSNPPTGHNYAYLDITTVGSHKQPWTVFCQLKQISINFIETFF